MRYVFAGFLIGALVAFGALRIAPSHAATHAKTPFAGPTTPCNFANRMEIQVIDGVWHECMCMVLANGFDCAWVELPEAVAANLKRRIKKHLAHPRITVRYAKPSVVA